LLAQIYPFFRAREFNLPASIVRRILFSQPAAHLIAMLARKLLPSKFANDGVDRQKWQRPFAKELERKIGAGE